MADPALRALAEAIPAQKPDGGRPRDYPAVMLLVFEALISVYGSARQVEAELSDPTVWAPVRGALQHEGGYELPARPMRRHHYLYGRDRYLSDPAVLEELQSLHRQLAADQARQLGLLHPSAGGSSVRCSWPNAVSSSSSWEAR